MHCFIGWIGRRGLVLLSFVSLGVSLDLSLEVLGTLGGMGERAHAQIPLTRPFHVVVDPGHGGSDEGTVYYIGTRRVLEKEITLLLARDIASQLQARGFLVHLTRQSDQELPLPARTAQANQWGADAFLSIHVNATRNPQAREAEGIETYILNSTSDASSRRLAGIENSVISNQLADSTNQPDVALILKDLRLDANLGESKRLACTIQNSLVNATSSPQNYRKRNRGVRQALFHVLLGADMPAILIEAGFLNQAHDRSLLLSAPGRHTLSLAVANALDRYRRQKDLQRNSLALSRCRIH